MAPRVMVLGATGLAGQALVLELKKRKCRVIQVSRRNAEMSIDLTEPGNLRDLLKSARPDAVINAAAAVNFESCEQNPTATRKINVDLPRELSHWSEVMAFPFVHISTDHFFVDGANAPHKEDETVTLVNEYARQKYEAETICLANKFALVLRTSFTGRRGWGDKTLAEWAITAIETSQPLVLFEDAWTSLIDAKSFARGALDLLLDKKRTGVFNLGAREVFSKADFIRELARAMGSPLLNVKSGHLKDLRPKRAGALGLDISKAQQDLNWILPNLNGVVANILGPRLS